MLCAASVLMLILSVFLQCGVYTVFAGIGVASYLGYLYYGHHADLQARVEIFFLNQSSA